MEWSGDPILLNGTVAQDPEVIALLDAYRPGVKALQGEVIGSSKVFLNGTSCRSVECNVGNLITDAMVYVNALQYVGQYWTDAGIGFIQGGGIRSSSNPGNLTKFDITTILPFNNTLVVVNMTGSDILAVLEHSVERYNGGQGEFLQMSGVHVVFDLTKAPLKRVKSVELVCSDCEVPTYYPLNTQKYYGVVISAFLHSGGDGFTAFNVSVPGEWYKAAR